MVIQMLLWAVTLANITDAIGKKKEKKKVMVTKTHYGSRLLYGEYAVRVTGVWELCPGVLHKSELSFFQEFRWIIILVNHSFLIKPDPLAREWEISNLSTQPHNPAVISLLKTKAVAMITVGAWNWHLWEWHADVNFIILCNELTVIALLCLN